MEAHVSFVEKEDRMSENKGIGAVATILLLIIAAGIGYLCWMDYMERHPSPVSDSYRVLDSNENKMLIVMMENNLSSENRSDKTQVQNALKYGGQIRIGSSNDDFELSIGDAYHAYGASNSKGYYYTNGAVLNYIASKGWTFVQAESSLGSTTYYFTK